MGLSDFLRRKNAKPTAKAVGMTTPSDVAQPKNGRLTLVVIASILVMIPLAVLNVRLILDPSIAGKAFGPSVPSRPTQEPGGPTSMCSVSDEKTYVVPPEVTFYSKLSAQDEQTRGQDHAAQEPIVELDLEGASRENGVSSDHKAEKTLPTTTLKDQVASESKPPLVRGTLDNLPRTEAGTHTYVVQVGAFTHPRIAQQWALTWKSRGYDVMLKPVARPATGVTYRLYLGRFESQKEADALVKKLKAKEGISAFRLLVRN